MTRNANTFVAQAAFLLISAALPAYGAQWTAAAGVAPSIIYTDNICLSSDNEQGEWIAMVTPDVSIAANGKRANLNLAASIEVNSLTEDRIEELGCNPSGFGNRKQFAPRLNAAADVILVEHWFYFDANGYVDQNAISPFLSGGGDGLNTTGNTNTTTDYSLSPYLSHRFKDVADMLLRYTWSDQYNSSDFVRDSSEESVLFTLGSNPAVASFFWGVQANYSNVKYGDGGLNVRDAPDSELSSAQLNMGYQFNREWQVNGYYGEEQNDFISLSDDIDGDFWDVGIRWTPNLRTVVNVGTGNRFFGSTPRFSLNHEHKRSVFSASYSRDLTYDRNIRTLDDGNPNPAVLSTSPILDDRFTLGYAYNWRRSALNVDASYSEQTRTDNLSEQTFTNINVALNRNLSRQLSVNGSLRWSEGEPRGRQVAVQPAYESWELGLGMRQSLNSNTDLALDYRYTDRQSDSNSAFQGSYTENRITLSIRFGI